MSETATVEPEQETDETLTEFESMLEAASEADAVEGISDAEFSEAEREHYEAIKNANLEVSIAQAAYDRANSIAKSAKKELELASLELSTLISDGPQIPSPPDPQKKLPFSDESPDPDAWKSVPIGDVLKLTAAQSEKLESAGITTIGRLEFVRGGGDPDYPRGLRSIKGIGERTVDAIENDIIDWLAANVRESEVED
ncbi:MAG TPA: hypothetical protein PLY87_18915 [Planctomycetaceae bacterium]|nr:hypothetical protein [Planctomycetaceae bacterium]